MLILKLHHTLTTISAKMYKIVIDKVLHFIMKYKRKFKHTTENRK